MKIVGRRNASMMKRLGRKNMEELPVTETELKQLLKTVDKVTNPTLYNKIARKYNKYAKIKVRLFRRISRRARIERELEEELSKGFVKIPEWLFHEIPIDVITCPMEAVTIDMIRMLQGDDKKKMLAAWHEWKARQKAVDVQYSKREKARIERMRAIKKDPEAFYERQRRYHREERERLHNSPEWIATHGQPRKRMTLEERLAKRKAYHKRLRDDPIRRARIRAKKHEEYINKHKDIPGWLEKHELREKRHIALTILYEARARRKAERLAKKNAPKRVWTDIEKKQILELLSNNSLTGSEIRQQLNLSQREMRSLLSAAKYTYSYKPKRSKLSPEERRARSRDKYALNIKNPEWVARRREKDKIKYFNNRDKMIARHKELYQRNREKILAKCKERYKRRKELSTDRNI